MRILFLSRIAAGCIGFPSLRLLRGVRAATVVCMLIATPALAQRLWNLLPEGFSLSQDDINIMRNAGDRLLAIDPPAVGRSVTWSNPQSGAHGTILLVGVSEAQGMPCRRIRYMIVTSGASSALELSERLCRMPDGSWKFL